MCFSRVEQNLSIADNVIFCYCRFWLLPSSIVASRQRHARLKGCLCASDITANHALEMIRCSCAVAEWIGTMPAIKEFRRDDFAPSETPY
jgi:hypothetical protein